jgi:hypothetical protein
MKKTLSVIVTLLLVLSLAQFAAAVETGEPEFFEEGDDMHDQIPPPENDLPDGGPVEPPEGWDPAVEGPFPQEGWDHHGVPGHPGQVPNDQEQPENPGENYLPHPGPMPPESTEASEHFAPVPPEQTLPGITPDQKFLWNVELALERLDIAMTLDTSEKAKKKVAHAMERLAEAKQMVEQKMFDDAKQAQKEHDEIIMGLEDILKKLKGEEGQEELDDIKEIEEELEEHEEMVEDFKEETLQIENLTPEQKAMLEAFVAEFGSSLEDLEIKVNAKKDRVIIKMKLAENEPGEPGFEGPVPDDQQPMPEEGPEDELHEPEFID